MKSEDRVVEQIMTLRLSNIGGARRISHLPKHICRSSKNMVFPIWNHELYAAWLC